MALKESVGKGIDDVLAPEWSITEASVVPEPDDIVLKNGAKEIEATYVYADMADSTGLAQGHKQFAVAKVIRCYLNASTRILKAYGGEIRSFDGDRVQGIFAGSNRNTNAVRAAFVINWSLSRIIQPKLEAKWSDFKWKMNHRVGVDTGQAFLIRGGVIGDNDMVSVGSAPNIAAKLSELKSGYTTYVTEAVYEDIEESLKKTAGSSVYDVWSKLGAIEFGGKKFTVRGANAWVEPS